MNKGFIFIDTNVRTTLIRRTLIGEYKRVFIIHAVSNLKSKGVLHINNGNVSSLFKKPVLTPFHYGVNAETISRLGAIVFRDGRILLYA